MQDGVGAKRATFPALPLGELSSRPSRKRVTKLGFLLRGLRRRDGQTLTQMVERLSTFGYGGEIGLSPEAMAAFERGDAAPGPGFLQTITQAYYQSHQQKDDLAQAVFLAADPFLRVNALANGDETEQEAKRLLTAPILDADDELPRQAASLLLRRGLDPGLAPPVSELSGVKLFETARRAGEAFRRAVADSDGRVPNAALTDGFELLSPLPIRVVFADIALSSALFNRADETTLAFSVPTEAPDQSQDCGGVVCLRVGAISRLIEGDPIVRFAFLHELGRRILRQGPASFFHERHGRDAAMIVPPGRPRRSLQKDKLEKLIGAPHPGGAEAAASPRDLLRDKAAATLFAFYALADPASFSPAIDRLDDWAARYGAPASLALAFYRQSPELFSEAQRSISPAAAPLSTKTPPLH